MAAARADTLAYWLARRGALALAAVMGGCAGFDPGLSVVTQDRFDFLTCRQIIDQRNGFVGREKELVGLAEKAEASPSGIIVSVAAYRSELAQTRTLLR